MTCFTTRQVLTLKEMKKERVNPYGHFNVKDFVAGIDEHAGGGFKH